MGQPQKSLAIVRTVADLRATVAAWHKEGQDVGLVPTMGALHSGHLALVGRAKALAPKVVASLFVNPTQFGPNEDFSRYPRDEAGDAAKLAGAGCDLLFAPTVEEMYPQGFATSVSPGPISERLEGKFRPGHFQGVATVVSKLLLQCRCDVAIFGEKDYQQLQVIRRVVRDLDIPVRIEGLPTVREADGLALSSRNLYLSAEERAVAPALNRGLVIASEALHAGASGAEASAKGLAHVKAAGFDPIDYLEAVDAVTLEPLKKLDRPGRILAAAKLGRTRLIDNISVEP